MSSFIVRVELHGNASRQDYEKLHQSMEQKGFLRTITGGNGKVYDLPPAEYNHERGASLDQVRDLAKGAASAVWADFSVLVSEAEKVGWYNLPEHSPSTGGSWRTSPTYR